MNKLKCKPPFSKKSVDGNKDKQPTKKPDSEKEPIIDFPIGRFMKFLKHIHLLKLLQRISDKRDLKKTRYKIEFILQWALSVFFFRTESLHNLWQSFEKLSDHRKKSLWNFFGLPEGTSFPHRQTISDCLGLLDESEINDLLFQLFSWALKSKIFYKHRKLLSTEISLACDGFVIHHYKKPHSVNGHGENNCPYCLPRTHNKEKSNETTTWIHAFVNVAVILPGGIQLPLYVHALKAVQLQGQEGASDEKHKQECELQAAKEIFPLIKKKFPRLNIILLTDSLYANEPLLKLCNDLGWGFLIVRQVGSLKRVAKHCDELEKTEIYKSYQAQEIIPLKNGGKIVRRVRWFNNEQIGNQEAHIIRFLEEEYDALGNLVKNGKGEKKCFKTEWLSSTRVTKNNCFALTKRARTRADYEDLHNTFKNRGFNAKHDYARSHANANLIWKMLMFVAFWIFELFSCTRLAQGSKGSGTWTNLAETLLVDLLRESWEKISLSPSWVKDRMQFRMNFSGH